MPAKKPTEQQLKDRLWAMAQTVDYHDDDIGGITSHPDYLTWDAAMRKRPIKMLKTTGFEASSLDIGKILEEVEHSCLTDKCKKSLIKALKGAK